MHLFNLAPGSTAANGADCFCPTGNRSAAGAHSNASSLPPSVSRPDTRKKENETSASEEQRLFLLFGNKTKGTGLVLLELPVEDLWKRALQQMCFLMLKETDTKQSTEEKLGFTRFTWKISSLQEMMSLEENFSWSVLSRSFLVINEVTNKKTLINIENMKRILQKTQMDKV